MLYKHVHSSFLFTIIIVIKHNRKNKKNQFHVSQRQQQKIIRNQLQKSFKK